MKILSVVGTRPNLVKIAPILRALESSDEAAPSTSIASVLVHTGQHHDDQLAGGFFADLRLRAPDHQLGVGSGSHAAMTAEVMCRLEPVLLAERPDIVLVVGDVNSTAAGALTAAKLRIPVAHVEAGLRSFDRGMPEEVNRVVTDALSDVLFTTEEAANENLRREGHPAQSIHFVGNVMIDSLLWALPLSESSTVLDRLGIGRGEEFAVLTLHRPGNVDAAATLVPLLAAAAELARELPVVFPVHPRTRARIEEFGMPASAPAAFRMIEPLGYLDFVHLIARARLVLTDSGGLQEETTVLGIPCMTLRDRTERPVTVSEGTSVLVGRDPERIVAEGRALFRVPRGERRLPALWDGHAAERIVRILTDAI